MDFKSISTKLHNKEHDLFRSYCKKKGVTPSSLIREMILHEIEVPVPQNVAGKNIIEFDKGSDSFEWFVLLDDNQKVSVLKSLSPSFLEDLKNVFDEALDERKTALQKRKQESVAVPSNLLRGKKQ